MKRLFHLGLPVAIVLELVVVLPTSPRRLKLREARSGRLSSNIWLGDVTAEAPLFHRPPKTFAICYPIDAYDS
jgi:hypothetical protein